MRRNETQLMFLAVEELENISTATDKKGDQKGRQEGQHEENRR